MGAAPTPPARATVLVVDDDQDTLDRLQSALAGEFDLVIARTYVSTIEAARRPGIDVVLLDVALPGMDGLEVLRGLRDSDPAPEVIVLSAIDNTQVVVTAIQYGAADYVTKPFDVAEVRRLVVRACERRRQPSRAGPVELTPERAATGAILIAGADLGGLAPVPIALAGQVVTRLASSAQAALALFAELTPDLVILDTSLPPSEWRSVLGTIRASARRCRILLRVSTDAPPELGPLPSGPDVAVIRPRDLAELLDRIVAGPEEAMSGVRLPRYRPPVLRAIAFMAHEYAEPITLARIASAAALSARHLADLFREDTGYTVMGYLARLRVEVAASLLVGEEARLEEVARKAGFSDASHLSRVFLRELGQRPGQYRRSR